MKLKIWSGVWCAIFVICVIFGLVTRASYTAFSNNQKDVLNSYYGYSPQMDKPEELKNSSYSSLAAQSQLVVACRFDGKREIQNKCYLSEVTVTDVIKGGGSLRGHKIEVYEPVYTWSEKFEYFNIVKNYDEYIKKFNWQGKTKVTVSQPYQVGDTNNYTMMVQNSNYLLFLNPKPLFQGQKQAGEPEYVQLDNPYGKLTISAADASTYKQPAELISLKESMGYEILLTDASSIKTYFNIKLKILNQLHLL